MDRSGRLPSYREANPSRLEIGGAGIVRDLESERKEVLLALLSSDAPMKVIVAGPGTGKTFSFEQLLSATEGEKLVLTFINNLVRELEEKLGGLAEVRTLHRFCRGRLHRAIPKGLSADFAYEPSLTELLADDASIVLATGVRKDDVEAVFHRMESDNEILIAALKSGDYYDAVGHSDAVYRMVAHLQAKPEAIPAYALVVVDEYQDFSLLESRFIELLATRSPILIVGDDDQALYEFKHASPEFLRELAQDDAYSRFELPFCSRCTEVLVAAVHTVVEKAQAAALLDGRVDKRFECYLPDKAADSERNPTIIHAYCTVQNERSPLMAKYIEEQIRAIPQADLDEARRENYPAVLITGPKQFVGPVYRYLAGRFPNVELKRRDYEDSLDPLAGYLRLLKDPGSRLGWRILLYASGIDGAREAIQRALTKGDELAALLPAGYRKDHLQVVDILRRLRDREPLRDDEALELENATGKSLPEIEARLGLAPDEEPPQPVEEDASEEAPKILVTNLMGAKGLQAAHVFVVGVNDQHFPRSSDGPTDTEVCQLIVALTRATNRCHLVSCGRFGAQVQRQSIFIRWLQPHLERVRIEAASFREPTS